MFFPERGAVLLPAEPERAVCAGAGRLQGWGAPPAEGRWFFPYPVPAVPAWGKRICAEGGVTGTHHETFQPGAGWNIVFPEKDFCGQSFAGEGRKKYLSPIEQPCCADAERAASRSREAALKEKREPVWFYALRRRIIRAASPSRPRVAVAGSGTLAISLINWPICSWERAES